MAEKAATATRRSDTRNQLKKRINTILPKISLLFYHLPVTLHFVLFPELLYLKRR